jgi:hypothetical protein
LLLLLLLQHRLLLLLLLLLLRHCLQRRWRLWFSLDPRPRWVLLWLLLCLG